MSFGQTERYERQPTNLDKNGWKKQLEIMNRKLDKKNQLIKYLERKCGNHILKSTQKLLLKVQNLEQENQELRLELDQHKINKLTSNGPTDRDEENDNVVQYQFVELDKIEGYDLEYLKNVVRVQQQEIKKLIEEKTKREKSLFTLKQNNRELRAALMSNKQNQGFLVRGQMHCKGLTQKDSNTPKRMILKERVPKQRRFSHQYGKFSVQKILHPKKYQSFGCQTPSQGQNKIIYKDFQKIIQNLEKQKEEMKNQFNFYMTQLDTETKNHYNQVLEIFGLSSGQQLAEDVHARLIREISMLKNQMEELLKQFDKMGEELDYSIQEGQEWARKYEIEKEINQRLKEDIRVLEESIWQINERTMRMKSKQLSNLLQLKQSRKINQCLQEDE